MTAVTLPVSGIKAGFTLGESGWNDEMNRNLRTIDALLQLSVTSMATSAPPTITASGMRYIVPSGATDAWSGQAGKIAISEMGDDITEPVWFFITPAEGWEAWSQADNARYRYDGSAWVVVVAGSGPLTWNPQTGSYTLALDDAENGVAMNVGSANTMTVPPNSDVPFPIGTTIVGYQEGAGLTTVVQGAGVTIRKRGGGSLVSAGQYALWSLVKRATDTWILSGDLAA